MPRTFTLKIELGNEMMKTKYNVSDALKQVAMALRRTDSLSTGRIRDENGNPVGSWGFDSTFGTK